jgi:hypothetical protein
LVLSTVKLLNQQTIKVQQRTRRRKEVTKRLRYRAQASKSARHRDCFEVQCRAKAPVTLGFFRKILRSHLVTQCKICPQNLHSDLDLQIRQPCGVRGRGGAGGGAAGRTPERKFGKLRIRAWPEPRSQRPGLKLGRQAKQNLCRGIPVLVTRGAVRSAVERTDSMFGSWRKLPGA